MAALNAIGSTGVSQFVIDKVKKWQDWLENNDAHQQLYYLSDFEYDVFGRNRLNRRDAEYIVQCLQAHLPLDTSNPQKTTMLDLLGKFSDEALVVFCDFLRETSCHLVAVRLCHMQPQQVRCLLESLHTNTSVKQLQLDDFRDDQRAVWVSDMLEHKTDLTSLRFLSCSFRIANLVPGLRRRHAHLQTLEFSSCAIGDEGIRLILEIIGDANNFPSLEHLDLSSNEITAIALRWLARLRRLLKLDLSYNKELLDDLEGTQLFAQSMLMSDEMNIKELNIAYCGEHVPIIIKACENDKCKLQVLVIAYFLTTGLVNFQSIRDQVIESMPKMKKLEHLTCDAQLFTGDEQPLMLAAFQQNTSIVVIEIIHCGDDHEVLNLTQPILDRNQMLKRADSLLALQPKTQMPIGSKSGIWYMAFAKMAESFDDEDETQSDDEEEDDDDDTDDSSDDNASSDK